MGYRYCNMNPDRLDTSDCVVRAVALVMDLDWDGAYADLSMQGYAMHRILMVNDVWGEYLKLNGFKRSIIPDTCPNCYTIKDFCLDHPRGRYVVATGSHVVAVVDGNYYDTWDSGDEVPIYFWWKR